MNRTFRLTNASLADLTRFFLKVGVLLVILRNMLSKLNEAMHAHFTTGKILNLPLYYLLIDTPTPYIKTLLPEMFHNDQTNYYDTYTSHNNNRGGQKVETESTMLILGRRRTWHTASEFQINISCPPLRFVQSRRPRTTHHQQQINNTGICLPCHSIPGLPAFLLRRRCWKIYIHKYRDKFPHDLITMKYSRGIYHNFSALVRLPQKSTQYRAGGGYVWRTTFCRKFP